MLYYEFDTHRIYINSIEFNPYDAIPENATEVAPPETTGNEVAQWNGFQWVILPEKPVFEEEVSSIPVEIMPNSISLAKVDFLRLFTQAERIAIKAASKVNPIIEDYQYMLDNSNTILLTDPDIQSGVPLLEAAGLIGLGRAVQVLAGQPPE